MGAPVSFVQRGNVAKRSPSLATVVPSGAGRRYGACFLWRVMRHIKLSGREVSIVRAIGFTESALGAEIQDNTHMEPEDVTDVINGLLAAGFIESVPFSEAVELAEMPVTAFEVNPAYVHDLRQALSHR